MAAKTFKTKRQQTISDGEKVTVVLRYDSAKVQRTGTVRYFKDDAGHDRWELLTGDPHYPAIGFLPENVWIKGTIEELTGSG